MFCAVCQTCTYYTTGDILVLCLSPLASASLPSSAGGFISVSLMYSSNFDPLQAKYSGTEEVVIKSLKREIKNILSSYVGWFDPFCELIQNALDSVE